MSERLAGRGGRVKRPNARLQTAAASCTMPPVTRRHSPGAWLVCALGALVLLAPAAAQASPSAGAAADPPITLEVKGPKQVGLLRKLQLRGQITPPAANQNVFVTVRASGRKLFTKKVTPDKNTGVFTSSLLVNSCCKYAVIAEHDGDTSHAARFSVALPKHLGAGPRTKLFNKLLRRQGFHIAGVSRRATWSTRLAILAFRKTNGMRRNTAYRKSIFRKLLQGRGEFKPRYKDGRHVEVDISRQVMAFVVGDQTVQTFHVSTGAAATPTVRGKFRFYMRQPGYNSHRMYYSIYFIGGYATHGYDPVPTYNASHGCVRNPIPYSVFIYRWVQIGMPIYVYG